MKKSKLITAQIVKRKDSVSFYRQPYLQQILRINPYPTSFPSTLPYFPFFPLILSPPASFYLHLPHRFSHFPLSYLIFPSFLCTCLIFSSPVSFHLLMSPPSSPHHPAYLILPNFSSFYLIFPLFLPFTPFCLILPPSASFYLLPPPPSSLDTSSLCLMSPLFTSQLLYFLPHGSMKIE